MNEQKEANLQISGMTCAACANRIEKGLKKVEGVHDANVNFALEKTKIIYDPQKTNPQQFKEKVESLGYGIVSDKAEFRAIHLILLVGFAFLGIDKAQTIGEITDVGLESERGGIQYLLSIVID